jgi:hypothetical protein
VLPFRRRRAMKGGGVLSQHENYNKRISGVQKA